MKCFPNKNNFCGGNFQDWLEVNLIETCNGKCEWCIEKNGYHPKFHADWSVITEKALLSGKTNIILLGGEPTLHKDLDKIIRNLIAFGRKVWITTNGSQLTPEFIENKLVGITGINISIHSDDLTENKEITGIEIKNLEASIKALHKIRANIRFNCNCIVGYIDSIFRIEKYVKWAKNFGVDKIRFAELKQKDDSFVDLAKTLNYKYGLNDNPFIHGCNSDAVIFGVPVNFRQMCGLQTSRREQPKNPVQYPKKVLYYDGKMYDGWQTLVKGEQTMKDIEIIELLHKVKNQEITTEEAFALLKGVKEKEVIRETVRYESSGGCQY